MGQLRCEVDGRFISAKREYLTYTPFGGPLDIEPADPIFMHLRCWDRMSNRERSTIRRISWEGPTVTTPAREQINQ